MMRWVGLSPSNRSHLKEFARKISADEIPVPDDWNRLVVSSNGRCEWFFVKDFINRQIHGMSFERISLLFGADPPAGDGVMFTDVKSTGDGGERSWGFDFRERVVARVGGNHYFVIRVDSEYVKSGRIHLISAFPVSRKVVMDAVRDHAVDSSVSLMERVIVGSLREALIKRGKLV
jgi:hypothetical protein